MQRVRSTAAEGRPGEGGIGAALVQAVTAFVHGGEERAEVIRAVASRQADVGEPHCRGERVDGQIQAKRIPGRAEALDQLPRKPLLRRDRERAAQERLSRARVLGDESADLGL